MGAVGSESSSLPRVVVVGGGFAGLSAVRRLVDADVDVDVLLLDRDPYNTFQPLLYQVATGGLNPGDVTYALRVFAGRYRNVRFRRVTVTEVDTSHRRVRVDSGADIAYDYLILCCGVTANYFGIGGAEENAKTIYTRRSAIEVRDRVLRTWRPSRRAAKVPASPSSSSWGAAQRGWRWRVPWPRCATPVCRWPTPSWTRNGSGSCWSR